MQAYVYIGNFMFNTDLVRIGYAHVPDDQFSKRQEFMRKQQLAKQYGYGRWNTTTTAAYSFSVDEDSVLNMYYWVVH